MSRIALVRPAPHRREHDNDGRMSEVLTDAGQLAAEQLGEQLVGQLEGRPLLFASPWPRALLTAQILADAWEAPLPVALEPDLRPLDLQVDAGARSSATLTSERQRLWTQGFSPLALERQADFSRRCMGTLTSLIQCAPHSHLVLVTHSDVLVALLRALGCVPEPVPPGDMRVLRLERTPTGQVQGHLC